jgi:hypothetical protein
MGASRYRFRSTWHLGAPPDDVFAALERLADYPSWWREIRVVQPLGDDRFELTCQSLLPYTLRFVTKRVVQDQTARVLEAEMTGDLEGFSRWTIAASPTGTVAVFDEEVVAQKALLRRLELVARPAFTANHRLMMRSGERGLRTYLAGYRARLD